MTKSCTCCEQIHGSEQHHRHGHLDGCPSQENKYSEIDHYHCWAQGKSPAFGKSLEWHKMCCLCGKEYKRRVSQEERCCGLCKHAAGRGCINAQCPCHTHPIESKHVSEVLRENHIRLSGERGLEIYDAVIKHSESNKGWEEEFYDKFADYVPTYYETPNEEKIEEMNDFIRSLLHTATSKAREELLKDMRLVMHEWHGRGAAMVDDYVARKQG